MIIHHMIIFLLCWRWAIAKEATSIDVHEDQIAMASEMSLGTTHRPLTQRTSVESATIRFDNLNGFVPMTTIDGLTETSPIAIFDEEDVDDKTITDEAGLLENDPAYSTEARMFLNLAGPSADRRSFNAQDGQNEFEILKVNNETPAVANYQDFYDNMRNNLKRNRATTQERYSDNKESEIGRQIGQNSGKRTKDRIKKIEKYLTTLNENYQQAHNDPYTQYYDGFVDGRSNTQKDIFEPEKVQTTFHQQIGSDIYDVYGESTNRPRSGPMLRSNYEEPSGTTPRLKPQVAPKNRHSKPVVVVEPIDYKHEVKYSGQSSNDGSAGPNHRGSPKNRKETSEMRLDDGYDGESRVNREDRYRQSYERSEDVNDYYDENDYAEITERPRKIHKNRRRPYALETSRRLPKEHRGRQTDDHESDDRKRKNNNDDGRSKLHRSKAKPNYWIEDDRGSITEETSDEHSTNLRTSSSNNEEKKSKKNSRNNRVPGWNQVGPNIEVSHSNGFEIDQIDKPKLLVPVNLNLVPLTNFDHSTALGNSQGFDLTNVPNFVTATPIVGNSAPILTNQQSTLATSGNTNSHANTKNNGNSGNNNFPLSTTAPDIIVGQNTFNNPVQAVIVPQVSVNEKFAANLRSHYAQSTMAPMFTVTQSPQPNFHNIAPTISTIQNFQTTSSPRVGTAVNQNFHHMSVNPVTQGTGQFLLTQPTLQTFPNIQTSYNPNGNYNIFVNPNGLHGQNVIQPLPTNQPSNNQYPSSTTPQPNISPNNNFHVAESQIKKNIAPNSNGQFLASASFTVGNHQIQQNHQLREQSNNNPNDNRHYLSPNNQNFFSHNGNPNQNALGNGNIPNQNIPNNNNNPNHFNNPIHQNFVNNNNNNNPHNFNNVNLNNQQVSRPQENFYQVYHDNQNANGKTYLQSNHVIPTIIHPGQSVPVNFNNQNFNNVGGNLQEQQSVLSPSVLPNRPNEQNQQILKAANDIFENTWKQLQQLQTNDDASRRLPYQPYRVNDNLGATSNTNANTVNSLPLNSAKAHLPILSTQNVEIINPNIKPNPIDITLMNPYSALGHYPAAVLTTPIPIFSTTANFLAPRPIIAATPATAINLQNYVDTLTQYGAQNNNQANKNEGTKSSNVKSTDAQRPIYNPINFVPNIDLMKSQSILNSKITEPLPNQLNLVPVIPGGNFFKNTDSAHTELIKKPRLSSDLQKYADEMFRESLRTIYNTHAWNNDRRLRGNYSATELNELAKLKSDLQRIKASLTDSKYGGKDLLEAHHSETKIRTAEPSKTTKRPELTMAEIEQLFKSDFKLNLPSDSHQKNRPNSPGNFNDFRNIKELTDYLTPPKINSFVSKSPFVDTPKKSKKRPGSNSHRYNSGSAGNSRNLPRPGPGSRLSAGNLETSASNHLESGPRSEKFRHRYEKLRHGLYSRDSSDNYESSLYSGDSTDYRNYPTFTTTSSPEKDLFRSTGSGEQSFKTDAYDINHPRMHNLLGLLMKNKQLPKGSSQSYFRDEDDLRQYFENEKRRIHSQFYEDSMMNIQKKSDIPANMGPPAVPKRTQIRYHTGRTIA